MSSYIPPELPSVPKLPFAISATLADRYRRVFTIPRILIILGLTLYFFYKFGFIGWLISIAGIAIIVTTMLLIMIKRSVVMNETSIVYRRFLSTKRTLRYEEIESVVVFMNFSEAAFGWAQKVVIGLISGKAPISLYQYYWDDSEVQKVLAVFKEKGVEIKYHKEVVTSLSIAQEYPKHASYSERNPKRTVIITTIATLFAIAGIIALTVVIWQHSR